MLMDIIKARHSIRNYTDEQIRRDDLKRIWKPEIMHRMPEADREV